MIDKVYLGFRIGYPLFDQFQTVGQHSVSGCFPSEREPHQHETVTNDHHFVDLLNLFQERRRALDVGMFASVVDGLV